MTSRIPGEPFAGALLAVLALNIKVSTGDVPYCLVVFAVGNLFGRLVLVMMLIGGLIEIVYGVKAEDTPASSTRGSASAAATA